MTNVRPGDLAIVIGCPVSRFNGATCDVIERAPIDEPELLCGNVLWVVRFARPMRGTFRVNDLEDWFLDCWLRKLSGPSVALDVQCVSEIVQEASG